MEKKNDWRPSASKTYLIKRAAVLFNIRSFFLENNILEVETPILSKSTVTDKNSKPFETCYHSLFNSTSTKLWLVTSPEYHMKRLLSSNINSSIYQISRSFRNEERSRYHNPEFTMLEWYMLNYDMYDMIKIVDIFLKKMLNYDFSEKISYQKIFIRYLNIDPLIATYDVLLNKIIELESMHLIDSKDGISELLEILFLVGVEPYIGQKRPVFIYHYPKEQAVLAIISDQDTRVSNRFEIFYKGIELGNGFEELLDSIEQRKRFEKDNKIRLKKNLPIYSIDQFFLEALSHGLPKCSGIAIGIDRLLMLILNVNTIDDVIAFPIERC